MGYMPTCVVSYWVLVNAIVGCDFIKMMQNCWELIVNGST